MRALGERYLWIDRFCIIQDHPAKHAIISQMDAVFANAYCTIIATDGNDADFGLRGVGLPRATIPQTVELPHCPLVVQTDDGRGSKYFTRGWTYQELHVSPRKLIFANGTVFWACQASFWREQECGEPEDSAPVGYFNLPFSKWPNLPSWHRLVLNYNWRELSFENDAHIAFSGVERVVEQSFPGGFFYGLPELFFDLALLWRPEEPVNRRVKPSADNGYCLPSWSWLGWHGYVSVFPCDPVGGYSDTDTSTKNFRVDPLVDWVHVGSEAGQERTIRNDYHLWRARGERQSAVPTGWTFHTTGRRTYYTNISIPDVQFRYSLLRTTELPLKNEQRTWPLYLRLRTHGAFFTIWLYDLLVIDLEVLLADESGRRVGVLFLHMNRQDAPFGSLCELVAVPRGSMRQDPEYDKPIDFLSDLYWEDTPKINGVYEFYNVLWVKWEGDHVVREGVGRVEKSIWEQQNLEPIDTQLH